MNGDRANMIESVKLGPGGRDGEQLLDQVRSKAGVPAHRQRRCVGYDIVGDDTAAGLRPLRIEEVSHRNEQCLPALNHRCADGPAWIFIMIDDRAPQTIAMPIHLRRPGLGRQNPRRIPLPGRLAAPLQGGLPHPQQTLPVPPQPHGMMTRLQKCQESLTRLVNDYPKFLLARYSEIWRSSDPSHSVPPERGSLGRYQPLTQPRPRDRCPRLTSARKLWGWLGATKNSVYAQG